MPSHPVPPALIPRSVLFGNPVRMGAQISPDGQQLCWVAPIDGVMNLWVAPRTAPEAAHPLTQDRGRGITSFSWALDGLHLLYSQDRNGDENFHLHAVNLASGAVRDLTPLAGARGLLVGLSRRHRGSALVSLNQRDKRFADLYRVDIATGELSLVQENPGLAGFVTDEHFVVRLAAQQHRDGSTVYLKPGDGGAWHPWLTLSAEDSRASSISHLDASGDRLYVFDTRGRNTAALVVLDTRRATASATPEVLAEHALADIAGVLSHHITQEPLAYVTAYERREFHALDESVRADIDFLNAHLVGEWGVGSRSEDNRYWTVGVGSDVSPGQAHLYDRQARTLTWLYASQPDLLQAPLARMQATVITARDGLAMVSYLTLPLGADQPGSPPVPLVLLVHGGPWSRDGFGFNPTHQWLANRGYAALSVNFRGSTGFGKAHIAAGDLEWGAKMDDDLIDAVDWAVARGIADPQRLAIMGGSYGGYATLWAMCAHGARFACGVDIVGPSNLATLLAAIPPQWESNRATLYRAVGNPDTEAGRALLHARSPLHRAAAIQRPLLIGQGANDPRVKQQESDQMVQALRANGVPVTYVLYPDEGHGFMRAPNRVHFNAMTEQFLARHLGGRHEAMNRAEVQGHSAIVAEADTAPV